MKLPLTGEISGIEASISSGTYLLAWSLGASLGNIGSAFALVVYDSEEHVRSVQGEKVIDASGILPPFSRILIISARLKPPPAESPARINSEPGKLLEMLLQAFLASSRPAGYGCSGANLYSMQYIGTPVIHAKFDNPTRWVLFEEPQQ
jgi:hypothetical protein